MLPKGLDYSEEQMANAFERRLHSSRPLKGVGQFLRIFREVDCHRGRPDFVCIASDNRPIEFVSRSSHGIANARLLSLLKNRAPRSVGSLVEQSGMSSETVKRALGRLIADGMVEKLAGGSLILSGGSTIFEVETTAFELKLKNPRRAVFQAQQYTLFAQKVWIVVPPLQVKNYGNFRAVLARWGIGLAIFNPNNHRFRPIVLARRRLPGSREHQAYAMLRLPCA